MDKSNKLVFDNRSTQENIKGKITSESYTTYSSLCKNNKKISFLRIIPYLVIATLLVGSALIFISSIKTAFFNENSETTPPIENIKTIKTNYDNNEHIKVENVNVEVSELFNIPIGVRILELESDDIAFSGLCVNDIVVEVSGMDVKTIDDMDFAVKQSSLEDDNVVIFKVYRDGRYKIISPYEE